MPTTNAAAKRSTDMIGEEIVADVFALAEVFGAALAAKGYVAHEDDYDARITVYRTGPFPAHVTHSKLMDMVRAAIVKHLSEAVDDEDAGTRRRARTTIQLIEARAAGTKTYIERVLIRTREKLDVIDDDARDALTAQIKALTPANAVEAASRREYFAERRAKLDAEARQQTAEILTKWLPSLGEGKHDLADVWTGWQAAVGRSKKIQTEKPGVAALGRTKFYEVLSGVAPIRSGAARKRYVLIPTP